MAHFKVGDTFKTPDGPIQIITITEPVSELTVTDPTVHHPQDSRAGRWTIYAEQLEESLENGEVERGETVVV